MTYSVRGWRWSVTVILLMIVIRAGPARAQRTDSLSRVERWRADTDSLTATLARTHIAPFAHQDSAAWMRTAERLKQRIPRRSHLEITLDLMQLVADLGDSHTQLVPWLSMTTHGYPFDLRGFDEGYYVTRVRPGHKNLLGARLLRVGETGAQQAFDRVSMLYASDNRSHRWHFVLPYLRMGEPLYGLGLLPERTSGTFTFETPNGTTVTKTLDADPAQDRPLFSIDSLWTLARAPSEQPLAWRRKDENYWFEVLKSGPTLYVQYNTCREDPSQPFDVFVDAIRTATESRSLERIVIDLRHNSGGDSTIIRPLYSLLDEIDAPLFVIIGRGTFSSGLLNAITLAETYDATLVGEPTAGKLSFFGETRIFRLSHSQYPVLYSTKTFDRGPDDASTLSPDVPVSVSPTDFFAGRDPVLDAILNGTADR